MVRFGIVGAGGIAKKFARDIKLVENAKLVAVSARDEEQARKYKKEYDVPFSFSSYLDMAKSDEIDAVYIATPHSFHYEQAIMFMNHKKHVLVEKPISVNLKQLNEMINIAKENNVLLMEAMWTYFLPATSYIEELVHHGDLGELREAHINFGYSLIEDYPKEKRLLNPNLAGGSILDIGVYPISFYHLIRKSNIKNIQAKAIFTETLVDASCDIEIEEETGAKVYIKSSITENLDNNAELIFEKSKVIMDDFSRCNTVFVDNTKFNIPYEGEGFVHQIRSFSESISKGEIENPVMTHQASRNTVETMDLVRKLINLKYPFEIINH